MNKVSYFMIAIPFYTTLTSIIFFFINYFFTFENQFYRLSTIVTVLLINLFITKITFDNILPSVRR
ncbi:hypothetical protein ACDX78_16755 [Virgibacillus oceani]